MAARILLLTLQQALRSCALLLFPLIFISMFAWATAGSTSGNTTDPIRAALWLWLAAHAVHFDLQGSATHLFGTLTYLPLGAVVLPFFALRNGYNRLRNDIAQTRPLRIFLVGWYALLALLIALLSQTGSIKPSWYLSGIFAAVVAILATINFKSDVLRFLRFPSYLLIILLGIGFVAVGLSLMVHLAIVKDLTIVIQPGWIGGILFLLVQILYLPNLAISAISYLFGLGFSLGQGTSISPFHFSLHQIPAIPVLGALPTGTQSSLGYFAILGIFIGLAIVLHINFRTRSFAHGLLELLKVCGLVLAVLAAVGYLSSGSLITSAMSPVGVVWWKFSGLIILFIFIGAIVTQYLPWVFRKARSRS